MSVNSISPSNFFSMCDAGDIKINIYLNRVSDRISLIAKFDYDSKTF